MGQLVQHFRNLTTIGQFEFFYRFSYRPFVSPLQATLWPYGLPWGRLTVEMTQTSAMYIESLGSSNAKEYV